MPSTVPLAEKIFKSLYKKPDEVKVSFTPGQLAIKTMYEDCFTKWLDNPELEDKEMHDFLVNEYERSHTQAYKDIHSIKEVLGNVRNAAKEWHRYTVIKMLKESYDFAKKNHRYKEMIMAADKLGKYTKLDKDDSEDIPWEDIVPPSWEPSADPVLLNIPDMPGNLPEIKRKLREKYLTKPTVVDAEILDDEQ